MTFLLCGGAPSSQEEAANGQAKQVARFEIRRVWCVPRRSVTAWVRTF